MLALRPLYSTQDRYPFGSTWVSHRHTIATTALSDSSILQALPEYSLTPASPRSTGPQALPRPLVTGTPLCSPCLSMSPCLLVHRTSPGTHHLLTSPQLVGLKFMPWLVPPSVPPWVTLILVASRCSLGSRRPFTQPWIPPTSTPPWTLPPSTPS